jgi:ABC-2 type transport system ATP-binding protein
VIEVQDLHCRFGARAALQGLNLQVPAGGVQALVGANGAGKSTLMRVLLGFLQPDAGHARVLGADCSALPPAVRARIAYVSEDAALPGTMRVGELLAVQRRRHAAHWQEASLQAVLGRFALPPGQFVASLSRGERAGLALALALAQGPALLLLDEPTQGLDAVARRHFLESLLQVGLSSTCTVLLASHQLDEVERLAERLIVLRAGCVLLQDAPETVAARVSCWQAEFPFGAPAALPVLPGQLAQNERGLLREWLLLDAEPGTVRARLQAGGAARIAHQGVGLDRALAALLEARHG